MSDNRLPTSLLVDAVIRRCDIEFKPIYIIQKGNHSGGTIMLKQNALSLGCQVLSQIRNLDGDIEWMKAFEDGNVDEIKADEYIQRQISRDRDLWVLEIEDKEMKNPFEDE